MPKVSVVVPVYNAERYIGIMLDSILNQSFSNFEVIMVNDKSTDDSEEIIQCYHDKRIKIFRNEQNMGIAYTRNKAIKLSCGEYIAIMDDDDVAPLDRLEKEVRFLDTNPEVDVVAGHCRFIDRFGNIIPNKQWNVYQNPGYIKAYLLTGDAIPNSAAMVRKKFIEGNHIQYREDLCGAEDYRFWVECSLHGVITNLDEVMLYWRGGHDNETSRKYQTENRRRALTSIREYALKHNGFILERSEVELLSRIFDEDVSVNKKELNALYEVLKKIVVQARELGVDNRDEIVAMCRKRFGEKVGKAFYLWE